MIPALTRRFSPLLICFVLSGCSLPALHQPATDDAALFAQGLDRYLASGNRTALQQLPHGEWRTRAEALLRLPRQQQALLQQKEQDLADCQQKKAALEQDNRLLEETLKQLKEVLIDTERQAK